jgi:RNA polymerase sigma factor (sigma-70 family)
MPSRNDVTGWIGRLKDGDADAAQLIWEAYINDLLRLLRKRLDASERRVADEEDLALDAFHSLYRRAVSGQFPRLDDRQDLWQLLVMIAARKLLNERKKARRQKRGAGKVRGESLFLGLKNEAEGAGLAEVIGDHPSPELAAQVAETCDRMLHQLGDPRLRDLAKWKMEGFTNVEIASRLGCQVRTVERKLRLIRQQWAEHQS